MDAQQEHIAPSAESQPERGRPPLLQRLESHVLGRVASGFLVLIPLIVTFLVLWIVIGYVDDFIRPRAIVKDRPWDIPGIGMVAVLVAFYIIGAAVSSRAGRRVLHWPSIVLTRVPVVKTIYGVAEQATDALTSSTGHRFSRVVLLEWPRQGFMAMGFVTGHSHSPTGDGSLVGVYIPTVPNPTSGNLAFVTEEELVETDITVEEAMKVVFSGGIVLPEDLGIHASPNWSKFTQR